MSYHLTSLQQFLKSLTCQCVSPIVNQTRHLMTGNTLPRLQTEDIKNLPVPLISMNLQEKIVSYYQQTYLQSRELKQQAQDLLASIDTYLLTELGITLPEQDNSLEKRIFIVKHKEIEKRLDPYYFQEYFSTFFKNLESSQYPVLPLRKITTKIASGVTPLSGGDSYTNSDEGIPFIRSGNIDIDGDIDYSDLIYLKSEIHHKLMRSSKLIYGDLMIAIVGATIGQVGIYLDYREANINQAVALVRLNNNVNPNYVKELIKSSIGQMSLNHLKRPVARANINLEEISTIRVVLPPIQKQHEIAEHIQTIRSQAKQLQTQAEQLLANAKAHIEQMILGV